MRYTIYGSVPLRKKNEVKKMFLLKVGAWSWAYFQRFQPIQERFKFLKYYVHVIFGINNAVLNRGWKIPFSVSLQIT